MNCLDLQYKILDQNYQVIGTITDIQINTTESGYGKRSTITLKNLLDANTKEILKTEISFSESWKDRHNLKVNSTYLFRCRKCAYKFTTAYHNEGDIFYNGFHRIKKLK
jgi:hypothetical protein